VREFPDEPDMSVAVAYIDGELDEAQREEFELRLAGDPALAEAVEALLESDELLRRVAATEGIAKPRPSTWRLVAWSGGLAAAALVLAALGVEFLGDRGAPAEFVVALAPGWPSGIEYAEHQPELRGLRPAGLDQLRGGDPGTNMDARAFAAKSRELEARLLGSTQPAGPAGYFVLPIELGEEGSVVVLGLPQVGAGQRLMPAPTDPSPVAQQARFAAGRHVLPAERIELVETPSPSVRYHPGFLVPVGCRELSVLCAVRKPALDEETLRAIDAQLARGVPLDRLRALLESHGFAVAVQRVTEAQ
jgi:hypothetical protein